MVIVSDTGDQAVGRDCSFQEEEQTMCTAEGEDCERSSEKIVKRTRATHSKRKTILKERE
jgi:hypothetical protein